MKRSGTEIQPLLLSVVHFSIVFIFTKTQTQPLASFTTYDRKVCVEQ